MIGNLFILGMVLFVLYASGSTLSSCIVTDLRSETISTIVIAWGVLLESREELLIHGNSGGSHARGLDALVTSESKRSGLLLVCLGLLLEIVAYFDASIHMHATSSVITSILHGIVWVLLVLVCVELCLSSFNLARIRFQGEGHAGRQI